MPVCDNTFQLLKCLVNNIVVLEHFDIYRETVKVCNSSHVGLGAVLEQYGSNGCHPISISSRYLNAATKHCTTNEVKLLAVVYVTKQFRDYLYGRYLTVISDHKALLTMLNLTPNGNETFCSRVNREYDRLLA